MQSHQINTAPLIRNFATRVHDGYIQVTTKVGTQTLVRAEFETSKFPAESAQQTVFITDLVSRTSPVALCVLQDVAARCIEDQCSAVRELLHFHASGTAFSS